MQSRITPSPTLLRNRSLSHNQSVLARLVSQSIRPLGRPRAFWTRIRTRLPDHLHLAIDVRHRRIPNLFCQCTGCVCDYAQCHGSVVPARCASALRKTWGVVGYVGAWVCQSCLHSYPVCTFALRSLDSEEKPILSAVIGGRYAQSW